MEISTNRFQASWTPDSPSIQVTGEIDLVTAPAFARMLDNALAVGRHPVKLDMQAVTFVDASLPRVLVRAQKDHQSSDDEPVIKVVAASNIVERVLRLVELERFLAV
jgi:anti-anti-sigma factor